MEILSFILAVLVATVPNFWIEDYIVTNSIWWTVVLAWAFGRLFGYFEGKREKEDENND